MPQVLLNGVPMKQSELDGDIFEEALVTGIMRMTADLQKAVHAVSHDTVKSCTSQHSVLLKINPGQMCCHCK